MPICGLKNSVLLHWDGTLGDPFNNTGNGAVGVAGSVAASCSTADGDQHAGTSGDFCVAPGGSTGSGGNVSIDLAARPNPDGLHRLQVRNGPGPLSNEMPICVGAASGCR